MNKEEIIKKLCIKDNDTGCPEYQIAMLTMGINRVIEHKKSNKHDHGSLRGLMIKIGRRKHQIKYLKSQSEERYKRTISVLGIRK